VYVQTKECKPRSTALETLGDPGLCRPKPGFDEFNFRLLHVKTLLSRHKVSTIVYCGNG